MKQFYNNKWLFNILRVAAFLVALYGLTFRQMSQFWYPPFSWFDQEAAARIHFISGPLALIFGIFQFQKNLRKTRPYVHIWMGRAYVVSMLVSMGSAYAITMNSAYGTIPIVNLFILNTLWVITISVAVFFIAIKRDIQQHRFWMIRNYALTCGAITLRIFLGIFTLLINMEVAYKIATCNCYIWNFIIAEYAIYRIKKDDSEDSPLNPKLISVQGGIDSGENEEIQ